MVDEHHEHDVLDEIVLVLVGNVVREVEVELAEMVVMVRE